MPRTDGSLYPLPRPENDPKFTFGLIHEVGKVLADAGYPPVVSGSDHVRLQQALFGFIYATPVLDANGDPVELTPELAEMPHEQLVEFFAGRVPAIGCDHYIAASEARAGLTTCERCPIEVDEDQDGAQ